MPALSCKYTITCNGVVVTLESLDSLRILCDNGNEPPVEVTINAANLGEDIKPADVVTSVRRVSDTKDSVKIEVTKKEEETEIENLLKNKEDETRDETEEVPGHRAPSASAFTFPGWARADMRPRANSFPPRGFLPSSAPFPPPVAAPPPAPVQQPPSLPPTPDFDSRIQPVNAFCFYTRPRNEEELQRALDSLTPEQAPWKRRRAGEADKSTKKKRRASDMEEEDRGEAASASGSGEDSEGSRSESRGGKRAKKDGRVTRSGTKSRKR
ncbi:hypothetical protein FB45DRAFT_1022445 [Roridomyces roridus]|uniref:Uncharacterized protein n=1 Tax=Roridomyces roridus TaxID=1738132 RepID=A0AAD7C880_9AGAR|nr:hypothetical protein FB45DRAFT_1022445 [Roridomyces roridus]